MNIYQNRNLKDHVSYFQKLKKNQGYSVGVYRYEIDNGALFDWVKGKRETILGMPTKELLLFLKRTGVC